MLSPQDVLNTIHEQVSQIFPDLGKSAQEDLAAQLKLDLVTREEFETQQLVLETTRAKLEQLEKDFAELDAK